MFVLELFFLKLPLGNHMSLNVSLCAFHQYIEKLDLSGLISVTDDSSQDRNLDAARLNLQMKDGNIKFTVRGICGKYENNPLFFPSTSSFSQFFSLLLLQAPNAEARELWKGYIHSVMEVCGV